MATLERLQREVWRGVRPRMRIWLTEYGYQTNPPDRMLGVSSELQARYVSEAAQRAFAARNVDMLIHYLYQDEPDVARWQSGLRRGRRCRQGLASGRSAAARAGLTRTGLRTDALGPGAPRKRQAALRAAGSSGAAAGARSAASVTTDSRGFL